MSTSSNPDPIRERLLRLLRQKRKRIIPRPPSRPVDVRFHEIRDPLFNVCLTSPRAWEILVEVLEGGAAIQTMILDVPTGVTGYVVVFTLGDQEIYVKLEIGNGDREIFLRSYHLSVP